MMKTYCLRTTSLRRYYYCCNPPNNKSVIFLGQHQQQRRFVSKDDTTSNNKWSTPFPQISTGRTVPPKIAEYSNKYGLAKNRLSRMLEAKFGGSKIFDALFDRSSSSLSVVEGDLEELLYKDSITTRAQLSRGLWAGYATAAFIALSLAVDFKELGTECSKYPWACVGGLMVTLSFGAYAALRSRSYVYTIHRKQTTTLLNKKKKLSPNNASSSIYRLNKLPRPTYVLTCATPFTGLSEQVELGDDADIRIFDPNTVQSWPWWRRLLHKMDPVKANVRIRGRWFLLHQDCFIDGHFHQTLMSQARNDDDDRRKRKKGR